jgi:methylated-DNA-protein-cysteine methyltransferase related protein
MTDKAGSLKSKVYEFVKSIPEGRVVYYGMVAAFVGSDARTVGWILSGMREDEYDLIPWQRVVGKQGTIPADKLGFKGKLQRELLEKEGVEFVDDLVDMKRFLMRAEDEEVLL